MPKSPSKAKSSGGSGTPASSRRREPAPASTSFQWRHLKLRVKHTRNYIGRGWSHLELRVVSPKGAPCPLTSTGYLSHFLDETELNAAGGPVAYFTAWLDREAKTTAWAKADYAWRQGDLFR